MARITAEFIYRVKHLVIERELLGAAMAGESGSFEIEVCLPTVEEPDEVGSGGDGDPSFADFAGSLDLPLPAGVEESDARAMTKPGSLAGVDKVLVRVTWDEADKGSGSLGAALVDVREVANRTMASFISILRSEGLQAWLGMSGDVPKPVVERVLHLGAGVRLPRPTTATSSVVVIPHGSWVSRGELASTVERAIGGEEISLAEALLADTHYFRWEHLPQGASVTVLLAAIACEVRAKEVLRATAGAKLPLVELLLSKPRDFSVAARALFSEVMEAANGRSLKAEDKDLEREVGKLFELRNRIAHRGSTATVHEASGCGVVAARAFAWLASVSAVEADDSSTVGGDSSSST